MKQKTIIYILTDRDGLDTRTFAMFVRTELDTKSLDKAIKAASQQYLNTDAGRKLWKENCESFSYRDFMAHIPSDICAKHGFIVSFNIYGDFSLVYDDYNTTLAKPEEQDD